MLGGARRLGTLRYSCKAGSLARCDEFLSATHCRYAMHCVSSLDQCRLDRHLSPLCLCIGEDSLALCVQTLQSSLDRRRLHTTDVLSSLLPGSLLVCLYLCSPTTLLTMGMKIVQATINASAASMRKSFEKCASFNLSMDGKRDWKGKLD